MKAMVVGHAHAMNLKDRPDPVPGRDEILIRVHDSIAAQTPPFPLEEVGTALEAMCHQGTPTGRVALVL